MTVDVLHGKTHLELDPQQQTLSREPKLKVRASLTCAQADTGRIKYGTKFIGSPSTTEHQVASHGKETSQKSSPVDNSILLRVQAPIG